MEIIYNGQPRRVDDSVTVGELLSSLELPLRHVAVEVNEEVVPREQLPQRRLQAGDRVEVVTLAGGG